MLLFTSCGEDPLSERILGTWILQSSEISNCTRDEEDNSPLTLVDENNCVPTASGTLCNLTIVFTLTEANIESGTNPNNLEFCMSSYTLNESNDTGLLQFSDPISFSLVDDNLVLDFQDNGCDQSFILERQ